MKSHTLEHLEKSLITTTNHINVDCCFPMSRALLYLQMIK